MINRVLIRIKVVQLLYSYLLVENQFMLESQPSAPTKEKRFAYNLYLDMLVLIVRIADRIERRGGYRPLADTRFVKKIVADEKIKSLMARYASEEFPYQHLVEQLADTVKESALYKKYLKSLSEDAIPDDSIWDKIFNIFIIPNPRLNSIFATRPNYSLRGVDRMKSMMETTFRNFFASRDNISDILKQLDHSLGKARELYFRLLWLPVELTHIRSLQLEDASRKFTATEEDLNPNLRFVDNQLVQELYANPEISRFIEQNRCGWLPDDQFMIERLLKAIIESPVYDDYMRFPVTDWQTDCEFWRNIFKHVIFTNEDFLERLEEMSVFWNDDLDIIGTFMLKTLKRFEDGNVDHAVLGMYKDEEDARFGAELFTQVVRNKETYRAWIDEFINSDTWDSERLAIMDVVVIKTALAEILSFPKIPLNVSFNEYIEIAKSYSSAKSGQFVNGVLGAIIDRLQEDGVLLKQ